MKLAATVALASLIGLGTAASANAMTVAPMPATAHASPLVEKTAMVVTRRVVRRPMVRIVRRPLIRRHVIVRKVIR